MSNWEIHQLESQAGILQVGTAKVFGDGVVTMSLKLFWVGHLQVPYTLCYPIPSFTSDRLFGEESVKSKLHVQTIPPHLGPLVPTTASSAHTGSQTNFWII